MTFVKRPLIAFKLVPEARLKPSQPVEVTFVNDPFVKVAVVPFKLVSVPLVATRFVANKLVAVALLNTPVEDTVAPIAVPLIVPPEIATL